MTSYENQEPQLTDTDPLLIQVYSTGIPTLVKCKLQNYIPPLKVQIDYSLVEDITTVDLLISYSF